MKRTTERIDKQIILMIDAMFIYCASKAKNGHVITYDEIREYLSDLEYLNKLRNRILEK